MAADDSDLLPKPPPPRPARRDAAIEAALRRFDGADEPAALPRKVGYMSRPAGWAWTRHPQVGLALAASLVVVIGLPAALIVIRNENPPAAESSAPPPLAKSQRMNPEPCTGDCGGRSAIGSESTSVRAPASSAPPAPPASLSAQRQGNAVTNKPANELAASEPPAMPYAAPPPPPAAPMLAEKSAGDTAKQDVIVTGSRLRSPILERKESVAGRVQTADALSAPDRVVKDPSYAPFLTRLQAAVTADDRGAVIKLIAFPLRVNMNGRSRLYADAGSVRADYDRIFTPRVAQAILGQRFDRLFGRDQGLMIGDGQIWFDHVCANSACSPPGPVRIKAVNP